MLDLDNETDTDHATFRQYDNTQGSWMSPDPYMGSYDPSNPQSMNRYTYVLNNPLAYVDPDGTTGCNDGDSGCGDCDNGDSNCGSQGGNLDDSQAADMGSIPDPSQSIDGGGILNTGDPGPDPSQSIDGGGILNTGDPGDAGDGPPSSPNPPPPPDPCDGFTCSGDPGPGQGPTGGPGGQPGQGSGGQQNGSGNQDSSSNSRQQHRQTSGFSRKTCFYLDWGVGYVSTLSLFTAVQPEAAVVSLPLGFVAGGAWVVGKIGGC
jgi:RHS repeat-associated protein